ncbi:MAG: class I SAM-dependent methyltransferase [Ignavibacteria bacterium]|nr:class I SAM-dependent methyltransferase [Ignavibacteria bacterium]
METVKRFNNRAEYYVKYRPEYPEGIIGILEKEIHFDESKDIADIGSGTGILSKLFARNGNIVFGVEPNEEMRTKAEKLMFSYFNFISVNGTAENTTLADSSVDIITAAQAYHWFNAPKTKQEFKRILRNNGYVVIIFNVRKNNTPFMKAYNKLQENLKTDFKKVRLENVKGNHIVNFFDNLKIKKKQLDNLQELDFLSLKGRLLSCSYVPLEGSENNRVLKELKKIFDTYSVKGKIKIEYKTDIYIGKFK